MFTPICHESPQQGTNTGRAGLILKIRFCTRCGAEPVVQKKSTNQEENRGNERLHVLMRYSFSLLILIQGLYYPPKEEEGKETLYSEQTHSTARESRRNRGNRRLPKAHIPCHSIPVYASGEQSGGGRYLLKNNTLRRKVQRRVYPNLPYV